MIIPLYQQEYKIARKYEPISIRGHALQAAE